IFYPCQCLAMPDIRRCAFEKSLEVELPLIKRPSVQCPDGLDQCEGPSFSPLLGVTTPPSPSDSGWRAILSANTSMSFITRSRRGKMCISMHAASLRLL